MKDPKKLYSKWLENIVWGSGSIDASANFYDEHISVIGTAAHERCNTRSEWIDMLKQQRESIKGLNLTYKRGKVKERMLSGGGLCMLEEDVEISIGDIDKTLIMRLTVLLEKQSDKWVMVQCHASTPDKEIDESENLPVLGLQKKNEELEAKISKRTRELEIEAALERVRSKSLAMHHTSELQEVIHKVHEELLGLGLGIDGGSFIAINEEIESEIVIWGSGGIANTSSKVIIPFFKKPIYTNLNRRLKGEPGFFTEAYKEKEKINFFTFLFEHEPWSRLGKKEKERTLNTPGGYVRSGCVGQYVSIIIINHFGAVFSEEENQILKRFTRVFEQSYTRFLDLHKAETQAREAQIEAALERVRSRTMAMRESEELAEASSLLFQQMEALGVSNFSSGFTIWDEEQCELISWMCNADGSMNPPFRMPIEENKWHSEQFKSWKKGEQLIVKDLKGQEMGKYFNYLRSFPLLDDAFKKSEAAGHPMPARQVHHAANFSHGNLLFITLEPVPEAHHIFKRFADVFEQTYTRFLDLKKAEEQAREANIQLALERVRAKTMAMKTPSDLLDIIKLFGEQLNAVDVRFDDVTFIEGPITKNRDWELWSFVPKANDPAHKIYIPYVETPYFTKTAIAVEAYEKTGKSIQVKSFTKKEKDEFLNHYWKYSPPVPRETADLVNARPGSVIVDAFLKEVTVSLVRWDLETYSEDELNIFERFAKEFRQTYIRFLDIKKAEEQAREAQIEAALERVRARSMGMQKSDEIQSIISVVFNEIETLGLDVEGSYFITEVPERIEEGFFMWAQNTERSYADKAFLPYLKSEFFERVHKGWHDKKSFNINLSKKEKNRLFRHLFKKSPDLGNLSQQRRKFILDGEGFNFSGQVRQQSMLIFHRYNAPYQQNEIDIQERFARVFDQTYTRFLDLKKAEAQTREARIETSLERVRAQATAMTKSSDLFDIVVEMRKEFILLGHEADYFWHMRWLPDEYQMSMTSEEGNRLGSNITVPKYVHEEIDSLQKWEAGQEPSFVLALDGAGAWDYIDKMNKHGRYDLVDPHAPTEDDIHAIGGLTFVIARTTHGEIGFSLAGEVPEPPKESIRTLERFARVFDLAYKRFVDLEYAENQAREVQVELSLEKIRAQATGMQQSSDLLDIVTTMRSEFVRLGHEAQYFWHMRWLPEKYEKAMTSGDGSRIGMVMTLPRHIHGDVPLVADWEKTNEPTLIYPMTVEDAIAYVDKMINLGDFQQIDPHAPGQDDIRHIGGLTFIMARTTHGEIGYSLPGVVEEPSQEALKTLTRFASAFDLAHRRFEDLKEAEKQAHEAQIETALERVRSRSMGMQRSSDLRSVVDTLFGEFKNLGMVFNNVIIQPYIDDTKDLHMWITSEDGSYEDIIHWPYVDLPVFHVFYEARIGDKSIYYETKTEAELREFFKEYFMLESVPKERKATTEQVKKMIIMGSCQVHTALLLMQYNNDGFSVKDKEILQRFSKVFEQTYTRFLDLKRAEKQAHEARVEAALERVRSQAMAMQSSEELGKTIEVYFEQVDNLFGSKVIRCGAGRLSKENTNGVVTSASRNEDGKIFHVHGSLEMMGNPMTEACYEHFLKQKEFNTVLKGNEIRDYYKHVTNQVAIPDNAESDELNFCFPMFEEGSIYIVTKKALSEEDLVVFRRFSSVISLTYRRFSDLQTAERQARESQIETAVERVRGQAMAMHEPDDLVKVNETLLEEIANLGIKNLTGAAFILVNEDDILTMWDISDPGNMGNVRDNKSVYDPKNFDVLGDFWRRWKKGEDYFVIKYDFQTVTTALEEWKEVDYENYVSLTRAIKEDKLKTQWNPFASFSRGLLTLDLMEEPDSDTQKIMVKMAHTFDLAYQRFDDLQKAAEQAKEARKQASLDRIRAEITSMRNQQDLEKLTPFIWMELSSLGISFFRCGIFIMDERSKTINTYLSTPKGESIAAMVLDFDDSELTKTASEHWIHQKGYSEKWSKEQFLEWSQDLAERGLVDSSDTYQHSELPPEKLCLQFVPFQQGMLYIGTEDFLKAKDLELIQDVADTFSIAYTRYEDFVQLEKAKLIAENALAELRSTQTQLVHSEKMASLGELTAGIAHEIQNPLNFVNNFSDLNSELIDEIYEELAAGSIEDVKEILEDLRANEVKITQHGKRAEEIVRSMLQHSRGGDGKKELTDINKLADEYLRLSYHGLRAKDKSFNADFKCTLDESLPKLEVIPQDIGRVLLNLINNAFHATSDKANTAKNGYMPTVEVITINNQTTVDILIKDNGAGIPDDLQERIFQPFFTTKPTGSGTGLGLSLSYDIITKGHDGEIKVESETGQGSTFKITLNI